MRRIIEALRPTPKPSILTRTAPLTSVPLAPKVVVLNFDPIVKQAGSPLHSVCGWNDPRRLTEGYITDLAEVSGGYLNYHIVEWYDIDSYPKKLDGFAYTDESYFACRTGRARWHAPDNIDYKPLLALHHIIPRIEAGEIDEVWIWAFPYAGLWESTMVGRGAFFCNSDPVQGVSANRRFVVMGFSYERGVGEMLENFGHRTESIMTKVYGSWEPRPTHAWNRFTLYERVAPGQAGCGNVHFAPNSETDYDWGNIRPVYSTCDDWLNYPNLTGVGRWVDSREWGRGDIREHHRWWLAHLPRADGATNGISNNWWRYIADVNTI